MHISSFDKNINLKYNICNTGNNNFLCQSTETNTQHYVTKYLLITLWNCFSKKNIHFCTDIYRNYHILSRRTNTSTNRVYGFVFVLCVCFVDHFVLLSFFFWPLCCLSFDLRILITALVSSNSFCIITSFH